MHAALLMLHSWLRWIAVALACVVIVQSFRAASQKRAHGAMDARAGLFFMISMDVQFLLGLLLYFVFSPMTRIPMRLAMHHRVLRFWAVEHVSLMVLAVVFAHVARVRARRASNDTVRHRRTGTWVLVSLIAMLAAMPWPFLAYGRPLLRTP